MQSSIADSAQLGTISELFWRPMLPKVVILGLDLDKHSELRGLLAKSFENVLNVEFAEQVRIFCIRALFKVQNF
jgi:hypothetical protein